MGFIFHHVKLLFIPVCQQPSNLNYGLSSAVPRATPVRNYYKLRDVELFLLFSRRQSLFKSLDLVEHV